MTISLKNISCTQNYDIFKRFGSNRLTNPDRIIRSIQKKNLLPSNPIIVSKNMYIIDGQNRLEAARKLNIPIYFVIDEIADEEDIPLIQTQRPWKLHEYLRYYKTYKDDYKFVYDIGTKLNVPFHFIVRCLMDNRKVFQIFREGKFVITHDKKIAEDLFNEFQEIHGICLSINMRGITYPGMSALWNIINHEKYDSEKCKKKLNKKKDKVVEAFTYRTTTNIYDVLFKVVFKGK